MESYYIGVDVGTASVRAGLVSKDGRLIKQASHPLQIWHEDGTEMYEQSSEDVWNGVCKVVKTVTSDIQHKKSIRGIGFDATCSLVAVGHDGKGVTVSLSRDPSRDIIMWLDHRAVHQAEIINQTNHKVLQYVGGMLSPEMQAAKLLWLKNNMDKDCWEKTALFLDLPEYLTYRATGRTRRSLCSIVAKFNYMGHNTQRPQGTSSGWIDSYWNEIGLQDLVDNNYSKLGQQCSEPGNPVGQGLSATAAQEMALREGLPVGSSIIDAHAGGLGVIGADISGRGLPCEDQPITSRLAIICGTSTCHMAVSENPVFVPGVWGPYFSTMVPGLWSSEGGQSATGKLIDHLIETHPSYKQLKLKAQERGVSIYEELNELATRLAMSKKLPNPALLACDFHVLPDFHGNRSPVADATLKGMLCGLSLTSSLDDLTVLYVATLQALAHGTRHVVETMNTSGHHINTLFLCGGLTKNKLYVQTHATVTGMPCVLPREEDSVMVGSSILGACAAGDFDSVQEAMKCMAAVGSVVQPDSSLKEFHDKKHKVFLRMLNDQLEYRRIMTHKRQGGGVFPSSSTCYSDYDCQAQERCHPQFQVCIPNIDKRQAGGVFPPSPTCYSDYDCLDGYICHPQYQVCFSAGNAEKRNIGFPSERQCASDFDCYHDQQCDPSFKVCVAGAKERR